MPGFQILRLYEQVRKMTVIITIFFLGLIGSEGCTFDQAEELVIEDCDTMSVSYNLDIKPIIETYCSGKTLGNCHEAGNTANSDYSTYAGLYEQVENDGIWVVLFVTGEMPDPYTSGPTTLKPEELQQLYCWLEAGAPDN